MLTINHDSLPFGKMQKGMQEHLIWTRMREGAQMHWRPQIGKVATNDKDIHHLACSQTH